MAPSLFHAYDTTPPSSPDFLNNPLSLMQVPSGRIFLYLFLLVCSTTPFEIQMSNVVISIRSIALLLLFAALALQRYHPTAVKVSENSSEESGMKSRRKR